jgi:hypothetical protein
MFAVKQEQNQMEASLSEMNEQTELQTDYSDMHKA